MISENVLPAVIDVHQAYVDKVAAGKISAFVGTIDEEGEYKSRVYAGSASMGESIAADYHGRFLIELIQNANDVHPDERTDGEIEVVFDKRGLQGGVLYIANRGSPFARKNVDALCEMGLSSKPPGESIGNKGLGFRSVHHISDAPHIYSQAQAAPKAERFEGFCFRFADDTDLAMLIDDPRHLELARQDLPLFHVPRWLHHQPEDVVAFARRGFATVIVLPLRSQEAAEDVEAEIVAIQGQTVPMLLFLARLQRLSIRVVEADGQEAPVFELTRSAQDIETQAAELNIADLGSAGRYMIARCKISETAMKAAITEGVDKKQLHKHWLSWKGEGDVALAVRLDGRVTAPRLFTFLPMGEQALAPFAGYLHASFFPSANRKGLDASVRLNALLLDEAAALAARTIQQLVRAAGDIAAHLDPARRARAVVDLLAWRRVESLQTVSNLPAQVAEGVAKVMGSTSFAAAAVIPVLQVKDAEASIGWRAPSAVRRWRYQLETFTPDVAAQHAAATKIWPLWPGLGERLDPLVAYLASQMANYLEAPTPDERAELAVKVAEALGANRRTLLSRWTAYYLDLAQLLEKAGGALAGRRILLGGDGNLHAAMTPAADTEGKATRRRRGAVVTSIFSPPARRGGGSDDEEQLKPPVGLAENFAFLSNRLDWHGDLSEARDFLEKAKLVFEFDREGILTQLSRVMRSDGRSTTRAAGLRWAFQIWRQPRDKGRPIKLQAQHRFFVPTIDGEFIEANEAIFSDTWPEETHGRLMQRFLSSGPVDSADLTDLSRRRLADRSHYAFKTGRSELWTIFLIELGVQRGLQPVKKDVSVYMQAARLKEMAFYPAMAISAQAAQGWKADILAHDPGAMSLGYGSEYRLRGDLWWLPGQGDLERFNRDCRELYAQLIIAWLDQPGAITWDVEVRHYHFVDARTWPTPLKSFLRSAPWVPAYEPSIPIHHKVVVRASEIWLAAEGADRFPTFLRRPAIPVMRALERANPAQLAALRKHAGLRALSAPETLVEQAAFLASQYAREGFDRYFERHWFNLYHQTWRQIATRAANGQLDLTRHAAPPIVIARRGGEPAQADVSQTGGAASEVLYVRDNLDETAASLIEASGRLFFDARAQDPTLVGVLMRRLYGDRVRLLSEANYVMRVDDQPVGVGDVAPLLERCPHLRLMVAVALEALKGGELQRLPADRNAVIVKLEHVLIQRAEKVSFSIDGLEVDEEIGGKNAFSLKLDDGQPVVVIRAVGPIGWAAIDEALSAICEAIEQPALEAHLRSLLLGSRALGEADETPPLEVELERLCAVLHLSRAARSAVRETLGARFERHAPWLKAILHMCGGAEAVDAFTSQEVAVVKDVGHLREVLAPWLGPLGLEPGRVLEACKNALSLAEVRDSLDLSFEGFNVALQAVGEKPDTYPDLHASLVASFVHAHDLAIIDALRTAHAATLKNGRPAPRYAQAREAVRLLGPDPAWLLRYREIPTDVLEAHLDGWLAKEGAPALDAAKADLEPLEEVRRVNGMELKRFVGLASPLVRAWCKGQGVTPWGSWSEGDGGLTALRRLFDHAGIFEFRSLNPSAVIDWAETVGAWPSAMARTLDRAKLGIVEQDLNAERLKAQAAIEARRKEERSISFKGRPIDPEEVDWQALAAELGESLASSMLKTPLGGPVKLLPALEKTPKDPRPPRPGGPGGSGGFAPSQKTDMIGRMGEIAVYHWLKQRLKQDIDAAWRSKNATPFTGREGSDSLGYDFEVNYRNQPWQIEVKASLGDPCAFEMGETEVRAGRAAARVRGVQYWIAYVSNLSQPNQARVELLPNPMSEEGEAVLNLLGEGLRYGFRRS